MSSDLINLNKVNNPESKSSAVEEQASLFNKELRGEISAVEGYKQVSEKFKDDPKIVIIQGILKEHEETVADLKRHIAFKPTDEEPEKASGVWGTFVATVLGTAKALGETPTILALIEGEEHGLDQYMNLIKNPSLTFEDRNLIRMKFMPRQESHIRKLHEMLN